MTVQNQEISMRTIEQERFAGLMLLALSLAVGRPALAEEVFTNVESGACDDYSASVETRGNWVGGSHGGTYCELPGDVVHGSGTSYSASSTRDGRLSTSVSAEGTTRHWTTLGGATVRQGAFAYAHGYADRPVDGARSVEVTVSLVVDSLADSDARGVGHSWSELLVLLEPTLGCSDGSAPVHAGGLYEQTYDGPAVAPGSRLVRLSAACPAGSTLVGVAQASISLYSSVNAGTSEASSATGEVRVHSVELTAHSSAPRADPD